MATKSGTKREGEPIDNSILQDQDALIEVVRATKEINDWNALALLLGLERAKIKKMDQSSNHFHFDIVQLWFDTGKASWAALVDALRDPLVDKFALANKIAASHKVSKETLPSKRPCRQLSGDSSVDNSHQDTSAIHGTEKSITVLKEEFSKQSQVLEKIKEDNIRLNDENAKLKNDIDKVKDENIELKNKVNSIMDEKKKLERNGKRKLAEKDRAIESMREEFSRTKEQLKDFLVKFKQLSEGDLVDLSKMMLAEAKKGDVKEVRRLVLLGADVTHSTDEKRHTALHLASKAGHTAVVRVLLSHGAPVNKEDSDGLTSLHLASKHGHNEVVDILLTNGATVDIKEKTSKDTPLHFASVGGHTEVVQALLLNGAQPNVKTDRNQTPLHRAAEGGHVEVMKLLLNNEPKAFVNVKNQFNNTPLHLGSAKGHVEIVKALLAIGQAKVDITNWQLKTALHEACQRGRIEVVRLLLAHNAPVSVKDQSDQLPLHIALLQKHTDIARLLISAGTDVTSQDKFGQTPAMIAIVFDLQDILPSIGATRKEDINKYQLPPTWKAELDEEEPERIIFINNITEHKQHEHPNSKASY